MLEQLGSSLPIEELHLNKFWNDVFQACKQFDRKIQADSSDELAAEPIFCNDKIQVGNRSIRYKNWIDNGVFSIRNVLKENGAFMTFNQFKEKYGINTDYITYIGCVQAIKSYILTTGLTIANDMSNHVIKTLKVIYSGQKGARLHYEVLIQDVNEPKCEKWETKLNTDINWNTSSKKIF